MPRNPIPLSRTNRSLIERERRSQMKVLLSKLSNLLPQPAKMSTPQLVEHATVCVSQLQKRMEELKQRKRQLEADHISPQATTTRTISPVIDITDLGSTLEINLITGMDAKFVLCDIISMLEEEGAEVLSATYHKIHNDGNKVLFSISAQAAYSRIGIDNFRLHERLKRLQIS